MTMLTGPPFAPVPPPPPRETGPWPVVAAVLTGFWVVLVTVPGQVGGWLVEQVMLVMGLDRAVAVWPVVAVVTVLLAGAPSLALALALSEQLAGMSTTAASLESIVLDEGFGTLDAATLDTVAATLENLAARGDRMVGVVTHVPALAERIPVRFEVRKDARTARVERTGL
ncbi:hypothetical protein DLJ57_21695 [Micromonospora chalcea]|nr:hypothetical protein DLJ57_21695 [Micromonospora chalcea]